ncbi:hypothetical protein NE237_001201 [Protea cynaroides]|uniref:Retrotransposon Copia-like N-terminal domain-containing protein n=1 Tax=Protea cynaroides TaxID=273540 RepID=A0A9Q0QY90_9MAGN|nr:hypothetical protein NE237_001201 [Protea cynaroides]
MASLNTQSENTSIDGTTTTPIAIDGTNSTLFSPPSVISNRTSLIPIKLSSSNYLLWQSLFEPILHGPKLLGLIDGTVPSPISPTSPWYERDQMLLSWINASLNKAALPYIVDKTKGKLLFQGPVENGLHHSSMLVSVICPIPFKRLSAISSLAQINEMFAFSPHLSLLRVIGLCFLSLHPYLIVLQS